MSRVIFLHFFPTKRTSRPRHQRKRESLQELLPFFFSFCCFCYLQHHVWRRRVALLLVSEQGAGRRENKRKAGESPLGQSSSLAHFQSKKKLYRRRQCHRHRHWLLDCESWLRRRGRAKGNLSFGPFPERCYLFLSSTISALPLSSLPRTALATPGAKPSFRTAIADFIFCALESANHESKN